MAADWYTKSGNVERGPLTVRQLRTLVRDGTLTLDDRVRTGQSDQWIRAGLIEGLFDVPVAEPPLVSPPRQIANGEDRLETAGKANALEPHGRSRTNRRFALIGASRPVSNFDPKTTAICAGIFAVAFIAAIGLLVAHGTGSAGRDTPQGTSSEAPTASDHIGLTPEEQAKQDREVQANLQEQFRKDDAETQKALDALAQSGMEAAKKIVEDGQKADAEIDRKYQEAMRKMEAFKQRTAAHPPVTQKEKDAWFQELESIR